MNNERIAETKASADRLTRSTAAASIKQAMLRNLSKSLGRGWRAWKSFTLYRRIQSNNRYLGVDMVKRTVAAITKKSVVRAFNAWLGEVQLYRQQQDAITSNVRAMLHVVERILHRAVAASFSTWVSYLQSLKYWAMVREQDAAQDKLHEEMRNNQHNSGVRMLRFIFESHNNKQVRAAGRTRASSQDPRSPPSPLSLCRYSRASTC
jgi:hypothetical protein